MRHVLASIVAALLARDVGAQFDQFNWTLKGNPSGSGFVTPGLLHVTGPDGVSCGLGNAAWMETTLSYPALVSVLVDYTTLDAPCDLFDAPTWVLDGVPAAEGKWPSFWCPGTYSFEFEVLPGQSFGFGIWSLDCGEGPGLGDFHDLVVLPFEWKAIGAPLDPQIGYEVEGDALDRVGDVDGDGADDFVTGYTDSQPHAVRVWSGQDGELLHEIVGTYQLGKSVVGPGDLDGDGVHDVAAGAPQTPPLSSGTVQAWRGQDASPLFTVGGTTTSHFGSVVAAPGDLDGDGLPDLMARTNKLGAQVHLLSGLDGHTLAVFGSPMSGQVFAAAMDGAGDVDLDGVPDLLLGSPGSLFAGVGRAALHSGATQAELVAFHGTSPEFGRGVAGAGDLDGDGLPDVVVSEPSFQLPDVGAVTAFSGGGAVLYQVTGNQQAQLKAGVAAGADLDGDGGPDLVTSADQAPAVLQVRDGASGAVLHEFVMDSSTSVAGTVAILGNLDGLGTEDVGCATQGVQVFKALDGLGAPLLEGAGPVAPGEEVFVTVSQGLPAAPALLVLGTTPLQVPFLGGVLQPQPELLLPFVLDEAGQAVLHGRWPEGLPIHSVAWLQAWIADPAGPQGWTCTNGLVATQLGG